ncbi:Fc.00g064480.m01.CDS01 [Cosmosporella sp. VM-42]
MSNDYRWPAGEAPKWYAEPHTIEQERVNRKNYIPMGVLKIPRDESNIMPELWSLEELQTWKIFAPWNIPVETLDYRDPWLRDEFQIPLLNGPLVKEYYRLHISRWVSFEFSTHTAGSEFGTLRVYILPDDVLRRYIHREANTHREYLHALIHSLDYSKEAWNGNHGASRLSSPPLFPGADTIVDQQDVSLLWLFNNIPSPRPNPESVLEPHSRDVMNDLLNSNVPGLLTELYPYQRRSAALMLQKEVQPGRILDPRFVHVMDQEGEGWYLDPVTGLLLREPRYYDGISGGILAEEMGSGKTIICLSLILATKNLPTSPPEAYRGGELPIRKRIVSLADMAAACATRNGVPWKPYFDMYKKHLGEEFTHCIEALERNPGFYHPPRPEYQRLPRAASSQSWDYGPPRKILLSTGSVVIVPNNLMTQWRHEIRKHTQGLNVLFVGKGVGIPEAETLVTFDLIVFAQTRFEMLVRQNGGMNYSPLVQVHFKRCIVDEGHKLGNSKMGRKSDLLIGLDALKFSSRWIVTGTPSHGLFGTGSQKATSGEPQRNQQQITTTSSTNATSVEMERKDLERIGSITTLYLKARPWANVDRRYGDGDYTADWNVYLMLPKHTSKSHGRGDCLRTTLNQLIIRHQFSEMGDLLPPVDEKVVVLDGSYQDQLSLNIFSMMIIFNSVQSQRTDQDYFFHPKQKRSLLQIVQNLKQASFFGGSFFTFEEIEKSVQTAEDFLRDKKVPVSPEDEHLLRQAIKVGHVAMGNRLRLLSNQFHEMPVSVKDFPSGAGQSWSLDGETGDPVCSSASMLLALQKLISKSASNPEALNSLLNGQLIQEGLNERDKMMLAQSKEDKPKAKAKESKTLAGNTKLGNDSPPKKRSHGVKGPNSKDEINPNTFLGPLELTKIISTVSAKLSYLIDSIVKYQDDEKILVFYENDNVAWYLASMLDVLQIQHLIYAKGLTADRRAQYVNTFHHNSTFRVLLMDISQAAFGLDMQAASRIYFINPVLNPQVEAQAIGRVRRINQQKPVSVETLVLRNSIEEVILERKEHMTQAEHRQVKSILDVRPIYNWIKSAKIIALPEGNIDSTAQMAPLHSIQFVFGRGFGRAVHPDDGIILGESAVAKNGVAGNFKSRGVVKGSKRTYAVGPGEVEPGARLGQQNSTADTQNLAAPPARKVRFG